MIVREQLESVQPEDLCNDDVLFDKATQFYTVFSTLATLQNTKITETRKRNLAEKRQEKRNPTFITPLSSHTWVGPPAPPLSAAETAQRIASISDPSKSSVGTELFQASEEKQSDTLANVFAKVAMTALFRRSPPLTWVTGRDQSPVLSWGSKYSPPPCVVS